MEAIIITLVVINVFIIAIKNIHPENRRTV
jgi:hypothetical protein